MKNLVFVKQEPQHKLHTNSDKISFPHAKYFIEFRAKARMLIRVFLCGKVCVYESLCLCAYVHICVCSVHCVMHFALYSKQLLGKLLKKAHADKTLKLFLKKANQKSRDIFFIILQTKSNKAIFVRT